MCHFSALLSTKHATIAQATVVEKGFFVCKCSNSTVRNNKLRIEKYGSITSKKVLKLS